MKIDEGTSPARDLADGRGETASPVWWQQRSTEELRSIMRRGLGSAAFAEASVETERRAREQARAEEKAALVERERQQRVRRLILETILLICLAVLVVVTRSQR